MKSPLLLLALLGFAAGCGEEEKFSAPPDGFKTELPKPGDLSSSKQRSEVNQPPEAEKPAGQ